MSFNFDEAREFFVRKCERCASYSIPESMAQELVNSPGFLRETEQLRKQLQREQQMRETIEKELQALRIRNERDAETIMKLSTEVEKIERLLLQLSCTDGHPI